jgi:hypothetical protein
MDAIGGTAEWQSFSSERLSTIALSVVALIVAQGGGLNEAATAIRNCYLMERGSLQ